MAKKDEKTDAKALVSSVLSQIRGETHEPGPQEQPAPMAEPLTAADLAKSILRQTGPGPATGGAPGEVPPSRPSHDRPVLPADEDPVPPSLSDNRAPSLPAGDAPHLPGDTASLITAALAQSIMDKLGPDQPAGEGPDGEPVGEDLGVEVSEEDAAALIEVYFDLEVPEERDVLMRRLVEMKLPVVTEFLKTMMHEDEDDYVRAEAAAELARRREPEGLEAIEADFDDPEEPFFFENAMKALCDIRGVGFYGTLRAMWLDPECDGDKRRDVMLGMEDLDLNRALDDFIGFVESTTDINEMLDDQIEVAMMTFIRHDHQEAIPALEGLRTRIAGADIDPDERVELGEFIQEGLDLLRGT